MTALRDAEALVSEIRRVHEAIRDHVVAACEQGVRGGVADETGGAGDEDWIGAAHRPTPV